MDEQQAGVVTGNPKPDVIRIPTQRGQHEQINAQYRETVEWC